MTQPAFTYEHSARTPVTALVVGAIWLALAAAWFWLEAAGWILGLFALFTLPALMDLLRNPQSGLELTADTLHWHTHRQNAKVALSEIDHLRLDTRLDFSVRASVILRSGGKIRLPFEATPPHQAFEDALHKRDVKTKRFHFQLFQ